MRSNCYGGFEVLYRMNAWKTAMLACALLWHSAGAQAQDRLTPSAPTWECLQKASSGFGIPVPVILAIAKTEGGRVGMESPNTNGSYDLGIMQVNDRVWVPVLARIMGGNEAYARAILRDHGCANIMFGTWILRQEYDRSGDMATAIGWYHSHTPVHMNRYQEKIRESLVALMSKMRSAQ